MSLMDRLAAAELARLRAERDALLAACEAMGAFIEAWPCPACVKSNENGGGLICDDCAAKYRAAKPLMRAALAQTREP
jgi:hypothetical protein